MDKRLNRAMVWAGDWLNAGRMLANRLLLPSTKLPRFVSRIFLPTLIAAGFLRLAFLLLAFILPNAARAADLPIDQLTLPPGFTIEVLARVPNARQMALGDGGVLYVGSREAGKVYAVPLDAAYRAGPVQVIASGLVMPVGVAFRAGDLYVSAVNRILRFDRIGQRLANPPPPVVVKGDLPSETHHGQVFIAEHGSWNRQEKIGYRVSVVRLAGDKAVAYEPFVSGWLKGGRVWGRPADVLVLPDGSLLISDDLAGAIYRVRYTGGVAK